jgi:hypothetical protein
MIGEKGLVVKPTDNKGEFVRVGCFRDWLLSKPGLEPETDETYEFVERMKREMEKLTDGERGVLGESVGLDEKGLPV